MTRRERLEARADRRREWASSAAARADAAHERVHAIADQIPFGQPILVGHHSEGRARRDQALIESGMRTSVDESRKAKRHEETAGEIDRQLRRSVFSDDVDAVEQLRERIARLEQQRVEIKAQPGRGGYRLRNLTADIRRNRLRLEELERQQAMRAAGDRGRPRVMQSRYGGTCPDCGEGFDRGDTIYWFRVSREAVCRRCGEKPAEPQLRYAVKCDECRAEFRRTDSVAESAAGGYCPACRAELDAKYGRATQPAAPAPEVAEPEELEVLCGSCGEPLDDRTLDLLHEDRDFIQHEPYDHYACFDATEANFAAVRARLGLPPYNSGAAV